CARPAMPTRPNKPSDHGRIDPSRPSKTAHCGRERVERRRPERGRFGRRLMAWGDMKGRIAMTPELWFERPGFPGGPRAEPSEECPAQCGLRLPATQRARDPHSKEQ